MFTNRPAKNSNSQFDTRTATDLSGTGQIDTLNTDVYLIRDSVQRKLLNETEGDINNISNNQLRQMIENLFNQVLVEEHLIYTRNQRAKLLDWVISDILEYGPLVPLLQDPTITEVMCNGPHAIYIERNGIIEETNSSSETKLI
jgi:pilus assembly protein CpaF